MARGRKKVSTDSLDAKIEHQKAVMEKAKLKYEAEKEALADLIKLAGNAEVLTESVVPMNTFSEPIQKSLHNVFSSKSNLLFTL